MKKTIIALLIPATLLVGSCVASAARTGPDGDSSLPYKMEVKVYQPTTEEMKHSPFVEWLKSQETPRYTR